MKYSDITRKERGRIKAYLIEIYKSKCFEKKDSWITNNKNILDFISKLEDNLEFDYDELVNLKIILEGMVVHGLDKYHGARETTKHIGDDAEFMSAYDKIVEIIRGDNSEDNAHRNNDDNR